MFNKIKRKQYNSCFVTVQVLEEADRSLHDALCVIRCLVKKRFLVPGGGAPEAELAVRMTHYGQTLQGMDAYCFRYAL